MAVFNPPIQPTQEPSYGNNSRAIDTPDGIRPQGVQQNTILPKGQEIGDRSAEFLGQAAAYGMQGEAVGVKGFGDLFAGLVATGDFLGKAGVTLVKKDIEDKVYDIANRERQAYTASLEAIKNGTGVNNILNANARADDSEAPAEVSDLGDHLATMKGAKDGGKISSSYYNGRLLAEAKDLRARYPGFREEIDAQFAKVTGVNPANAYIRSLVGDINKAASAAGSQQNKTLSFIRSNLGYPNSQKMYDDFKAGLVTDSDVIKWAAPYEQQKTNLSFRAAVINDDKLTRDERKIKGIEAIDTAAGYVVNNSVDTLMGKLGMGSSAQAAALDSQFKSGGIPATRFQEIGQEVANQKAALRVQMIADADRTGITKSVGKDEVIKRVDLALTNFDTINDRIYNKDFGGIHAAAQQIKAQVDDTQKALMTDSKVGPYFTQVAVQKNIGGEQWLQKFNLNALKEDVPTQYGAWYNNWKRELTTQTGATINGQVRTFNDFFDEAKTKGVNDPKVNAGIVKTVEDIAKPDTPDGVKEAIIKSAFSPGNRGFISRLNVDGVNDRGQPISGQNAVFQKWTSPEVTKEVRRLSEKNPELWRNYENWAKETFGNELVNRQINDLKTINKDPSIEIKYDSDNHRFDVRQTKTGTSTGVPGLNASPSENALRGGQVNIEADRQFKVVQSKINSINSGMYNLKNVAAASGDNVDAFLLRTIIETGGRETMLNTSGIPYSMVGAILSTQNQKKK